MNAAYKIAQNTTILFLSQIISYILTLFYAIYITNYLGTAGFGILSTALALGALLSIFTELGLSTLTTREVSREKSLANKYISNTIVLKIVLSIFTFILMFLTLYILVHIFNYTSESVTIVYLITISFIVGAFTNIFYSVFQAYEKMEYQSIGQIINSIIMFLGVFWVIYYQLSIINFAIIYIIASVVSLIFGIIICIWKYQIPKINIDIGLWKFLIIEAIPLTISSVFLFVAFRIDIILMNIINGDSTVGIYNAAYGLMTALMFLPSVYVIAVFPLLSRFNVSSKELLKLSYEKSFKYLIIIGLPIAVGTTLIASPLILFIYKSGFSQSIIVLQILIWSVPIIFVNYILGTAINSINKQSQMVKSAFIVMALNIILNLIFLPKYGFIAASVITVITEFSALMFWYHIMNVNGYKLPIHKILVKPIIACLIMGIFIIMVNINFIIIIILSIIIYFSVLFLLKTFTDEDINLFKQMLGRN